MDKANLKCFFDLGNSNRRDDKEKIGEKGHGTKVYFNSRSLNLTTHKDGKTYIAEMNDIYKTLNQGKIPKYRLEIKSLKQNLKGTEIVINAYNQSKLNSFSHEQIKDYIYWKTKFGAIDKEFDINRFENVIIKLKGLDKEDGYEELKFGHRFPKESKSANKLFAEHGEQAPEHFCKKWIKEGTLPNFPYIKYQAVFYVEGN